MFWAFLIQTHGGSYYLCEVRVKTEERSEPYYIGKANENRRF